MPGSLVNQWRREIDKWAPELRAIVVRGSPTERAWQWRAEAHVTIVSYETLRTDFTDNLESPPRRRVWDLVMLTRPIPPGRADVAKRSSGLEFEERCARVLEVRGWRVQRTPQSRYGGVDLIARRVDEVGLEQTIYVQCKDHARRGQGLPGPDRPGRGTGHDGLRVFGRKIEGSQETTKAEKPHTFALKLVGAGGAKATVNGTYTEARGGTDATVELEYDLPMGLESTIPAHV